MHENWGIKAGKWIKDKYKKKFMKSNVKSPRELLNMIKIIPESGILKDAIGEAKQLKRSER